MAKHNCPKCNTEFKSSIFLVTKTTYRCTKCSTRITVAPGLLFDKVVDWETPEERSKR